VVIKIIFVYQKRRHVVLSQSQKQIVTIGFDARLSGQRHAGIGRYIENLLIEIIKTTPNFIKLLIFFHDQEQEQAIRSNLKNKIKYQAVFVPIRHYSFAEQFNWPKILLQHKLDLLHVPHFNIPLLYQGKIVVTIHDLLWHEQIGPEATTLPVWKYYFKYLAYRLVTNRALLKAEKIFVPTRAVSKVLNRYQPAVKNKTVVTYEGISQSFASVHKKLLANPDLSFQKKYDPVLIYVGSLYPHKNINVVLQALKALDNFSLKIVCARNVFMKRTQEKVAELGLEDRVEFTGYLEDKQLIKELQSALALVQPSKSEGFGLTAIEAMAVGTPVIASNLPVFKEIYQSAPLYFHPDNPNQLIDLIKQLKNKKTRDKQIKIGLETAKKYTWKTAAKTTLDHYLSVIT
jgi:glycosyltransferase involved in cell wall biosynthesis